MTPPRRPTSRRRKRLGQHFLTDRRVLARILDYADLQPDDVVLEIGPGPGTLTRALAERVRKVVAVELDPELVATLRRDARLGDRVDIVHADAARADLAPLGPFAKIVANLPYSASSPITFQLLELRFQRAVLMYQLEFAQRLVADVGNPEYGRLSAARAYFCSAEILERVPPSAFVPPPEIHSAIVRLDPHSTPPFPVGTPASYSELLRILFSTRRKTIRASLRGHAAHTAPAPWARVEASLQDLRVTDRRPEELTPRQLGALDQTLEALRRGDP